MRDDHVKIISLTAAQNLGCPYCGFAYKDSLAIKIDNDSLTHAEVARVVICRMDRCRMPYIVLPDGVAEVDTITVNHYTWARPCQLQSHPLEQGTLGDNIKRPIVPATYCFLCGRKADPAWIGVAHFSVGGLIRTLRQRKIQEITQQIQGNTELSADQVVDRALQQCEVFFTDPIQSTLFAREVRAQILEIVQKQVGQGAVIEFDQFSDELIRITVAACALHHEEFQQLALFKNAKKLFSQ